MVISSVDMLLTDHRTCAQQACRLCVNESQSMRAVVVVDEKGRRSPDRAFTGIHHLDGRASLLATVNHFIRYLSLQAPVCTESNQRRALDVVDSLSKRACAD